MLNMWRKITGQKRRKQGQKGSGASWENRTHDSQLSPYILINPFQLGDRFLSPRGVATNERLHSLGTRCTIQLCQQSWVVQIQMVDLLQYIILLSEKNKELPRINIHLWKEGFDSNYKSLYGVQSDVKVQGSHDHQSLYHEFVFLRLQTKLLQDNWWY